MNASQIKALTTYDACMEAIRSIEMSPDNVVGGSKAFFSGRNCELTASAKKQIAALEKHASQFVPDCDD